MKQITCRASRWIDDCKTFVRAVTLAAFGLVIVRHKTWRGTLDHMASLQNRNAALMDQLYVERRAATDAEISVLLKLSNAHASLLANTRDERKTDGTTTAE